MTSVSGGSYRDRHSQIAVGDDRVVRTFDEDGARWFLSAVKAGLVGRLVESGHLISYEVVSDEPLATASPLLPTVTYPYEWSASMLRDAGLATLEVASIAWDAGFHLRDASAFNLVFHDGRPVLVDLGSLRPGHTPYFLAFGQFCDHFLNPLVLAAQTGVSHRLGWQGLEGLPATVTRQLVRGRLLRPGLFGNVWGRALLERRSHGLGAEDRRELRGSYGLPPERVRRMFDRLATALRGLEFAVDGNWGSYENTHSYSVYQDELKVEFVRSVASRRAGRQAVDIGANTGRYSAILADHFRSVIAVEPDEAAVEVMYRRIATGDWPPQLVPMVMDILDPTPRRGFANRERMGGLDRIRGADLVTWLAVFHHFVAGRNVPLPLLFELAAGLSPHHVVEHVAPQDPMAELLLANRDEEPWPFDLPTFEASVRQHFEIVDSVDVSETRTLYELSRI